MDEARMRIGDWTFDNAGAELRRGDERRRLEHRAARTLELLLSRRGEVVSHEEILDFVWGGRHISANSIPVVVRDLRRALDDDARAPLHIETVAKRGYRLVAQSEPAPPVVTAPARNPKRALWLSLALILAVVAAALVGWRLISPPAAGVPVAIHDVVNATGESSFDPLAGSVSELVSANLAEAPDLRLVRNPAESARGGEGLRLTAKLILWTGNPTVMFTATEVRTGKVVWSGMAAGPEPRFPATVRAAMTEFAAKAAASNN